MTTAYERTRQLLLSRPRTWLVTGAAGFIGSHLVETLLALGQTVAGLDNFSACGSENIAPFLDQPSFTFFEGDIRRADDCERGCEGVDVVLHHAARASVPWSVEHPAETHENNATGFLNLLEAVRKLGRPRVVYASSSAVYGDLPGLPKHEDDPLFPFLSPYALSKRMNEEHAALYASLYGVSSVGFRYFNIFGPRQDPKGPYAAVISRWMSDLKGESRITIYGDGTNTRDFCSVADVVQANILAAVTEDSEALNQVYNIGRGEPIDLLSLADLMGRVLSRDPRPVFEPFRRGDILHSSSSIEKARRLLGFEPEIPLEDGIRELAAEQKCSEGETF